MLFNRVKAKEGYGKIPDKIKRDLVSTFSKKGIKVKDIDIDMKSDYVNIRVSINGN